MSCTPGTPDLLSGTVVLKAVVIVDDEHNNKVRCALLLTHRALFEVHTSVVNRINNLAKRTPAPRPAYLWTWNKWVVTSGWAWLALLEDLTFYWALWF